MQDTTDEQRQTLNIKLYDNEDYTGYPIITIYLDNLTDFTSLLDTYKSDYEGEYNLDDFMDILEREPYFIRSTYTDEEIFF